MEQFTNQTASEVKESIKDLEFDLTFQTADLDIVKQSLDIRTKERDSRADISPQKLKELQDRKEYLETENALQQSDLKNYQEKLNKSNREKGRITQDNLLKETQINRQNSQREILVNRYIK